MPWYKQAYDWVERRVQLEGFVKESVEHPVPSKTASWWYVFGSASFVLLLLHKSVVLATHNIVDV